MILYSSWRALSLPTRVVIATAFGIAKVGPTHVRDNYIESDGYKIEDVENALSVEAMQKYTNLTSNDHTMLWEHMVSKAEGRELIQPADPSKFEAMAIEKDVIVPKTKRVYKKKTK